MVCTFRTLFSLINASIFNMYVLSSPNSAQTLVACILGMFVSGVVYGIGVIMLPIKERFFLDQLQASFLANASTVVGQYGGTFLGGLLFIRYNEKLLFKVALFTQPIGYFSLAFLYYFQICYYPLIWTMFVFTGLGAAFTFVPCVSCAITHTHESIRSLTVGVLMSAYGFSSFFFPIIYRCFLGSEPLNLFLLLGTLDLLVLYGCVKYAYMNLNPIIDEELMEFGDTEHDRVLSLNYPETANIIVEKRVDNKPNNGYKHISHAEENTEYKNSNEELVSSPHHLPKVFGNISSSLVDLEDYQDEKDDRDKNNRGKILGGEVTQPKFILQNTTEMVEDQVNGTDEFDGNHLKSDSVLIDNFNDYISVIISVPYLSMFSLLTCSTSFTLMIFGNIPFILKMISLNSPQPENLPFSLSTSTSSSSNNLQGNISSNLTDSQLNEIISWSVSFLALGNGMGRLIMGFLADMTRRRFGLTRRFWLFITEVLILALCISFLLLSHSQNVNIAVVLCGAAGLAHGCLFTISATVVSELVGLSKYPALWGFIMLGPCLGGTLSNRLFGWYYPMNHGVLCGNHGSGPVPCSFAPFLVLTFVLLVGGLGPLLFGLDTLIVKGSAAEAYSHSVTQVYSKETRSFTFSEKIRNGVGVYGSNLS